MARATLRRTLLRLSFGSRVPAAENPWHGGPEIMTSGAFGWPRFAKAARHCAIDLLPPIVVLMVAADGKFLEKVRMASPPMSTPATIVIPSSRAARDRPPRPQQRSITTGVVPRSLPLGVAKAV